MSDLIAKTGLSDSRDCPVYSAKPVLQKVMTHKVLLGKNLTLRRALPHSERRMIGAWCFLDHFGPLDLKTNDGLYVAPHPHIGLQTFTWMLAGKILHRDSLGSMQVIKPGQVNLMTAGKGISHSEQSLPDRVLHGLQLWIALPDAVRHIAPDFTHYPAVPSVHFNGLDINILVGELFNLKAPPRVYSPLIGLVCQARDQVTTALPLNPAFEYGILPLNGTIEIEGEHIDTDSLLYLGCGRSQLALHIPKDRKALLIGGEPFKEDILLWWNFVARTKQEISDATVAWNKHMCFGKVKGDANEGLIAPEMP